MGRGPSIEGRKGVEDARRGKLFSKLIREISSAARMGGADPASNARLRMAIDKAYDGNMSKDTVERALKRGAGGADGENFEQIRYEGYAHGGVAIMIDCLTDNPTRTVGDVRHAFSKCGGSLGTSGSVAYLFSRVGQAVLETGGEAALEERAMDAALQAGADDVQSGAESTEVFCAPELLPALRKGLEDAGLKLRSADIVQRPATTVDLSAADAEALAELVHWLEDLDDVQQVYTNARRPD